MDFDTQPISFVSETDYIMFEGAACATKQDFTSTADWSYMTAAEVVKLWSSSCAQTNAVVCGARTAAGCQLDGLGGFEDACAGLRSKATCDDVNSDSNIATKDCTFVDDGSTMKSQQLYFENAKGACDSAAASCVGISVDHLGYAEVCTAAGVVHQDGATTYLRDTADNMQADLPDATAYECASAALQGSEGLCSRKANCEWIAGSVPGRAYNADGDAAPRNKASSALKVRGLCAVGLQQNTPCLNLVPEGGVRSVLIS